MDEVVPVRWWDESASLLVGLVLVMLVAVLAARIRAKL